MSIKLVDAVLDTFQHGGSLKLTFVVMADRASDEGGSLFPSMATIARRASLSVDQARRNVRELCRLGYLEVVAKSHGGAPGNTTRYRIVVDRLTPSADARGSAHARGSADAANPLHGCSQPLAPMQADTSLTVINRQDQKKGTRERGKSLCRIPEDFAVSDLVRKWAAEKGFGEPDAYLETFVGRHRANGKQYLDWDATLMNAIREDWYHIRSPKVETTNDDHALRRLGVAPDWKESWAGITTAATAVGLKWMLDQYTKEHCVREIAAKIPTLQGMNGKDLARMRSASEMMAGAGVAPPDREPVDITGDSERIQ